MNTDYDADDFWNFDEIDNMGMPVRTYRDGYPPTFDRHVALCTNPHYSDERFARGEVTVFGHAEKGLSYMYDDRMWSWDYDKMKRSVAKATASKAAIRSAAWYDVLLSEYEGKPCQLVHALACVNVSTGYPVAALGYRVVAEDVPKKRSRKERK